MKDFVRRKECRDIQNEALADALKNTTTMLPEYIEDQKVVGGAPIITIFDGPVGGGNCNKAQKSSSKGVWATPGSLPVNLMSKPSKGARM